MFISLLIQRLPLPERRNLRRYLEMIVRPAFFQRLCCESQLRAPEVEVSWGGGEIDAALGEFCSHESAPCVVLDYGCGYAFESLFHCRESGVEMFGFPCFCFWYDSRMAMLVELGIFRQTI